MAASIVSLDFLDLPSDVLFEILAHLPAYSVVLRCRLVCHKLEYMSREKHLWIRFFHSTEHMLRQPIGLNQIGTPQFEISICRAELLEEKWDDENALQTVPHFWRSTENSRRQWHRRVAMMGDYMVTSDGQTFAWLPTDNSNELPIPTFGYPAVANRRRISFVNPMTSTFYLIYFLERSLNVMGIQVNSHNVYVAVEYSLPTRAEYSLRPRACVGGGSLVVRYRSPDGNLAVDIIDLKKRTVSCFILPPARLFLSEFTQADALPSRNIFATETHLITIINRQIIAIFKRPDASQDVHSSNTTVGSLPEITCPDTVLKGCFPWPIIPDPYIIPRSATSFAMVVVPRDRRRIHLFVFTLSETESSFEEICSVDIPEMLITFVLPIPPTTAQYGLGVLAAGDPSDLRQQTHFAVRIDFPDSKRDLTSGNQGCITLRRMNLKPAVNMDDEEAYLCSFDYFSGKVWFSVRSYSGEYDLVVDYVSV